MKKAKKYALKNGTSMSGEPYFYDCVKCGAKNVLSAKKCTACKARRPVDAYEKAVVVHFQPQQQCGFVDRTVRAAYPTAPNPCFAVPLPQKGCASGSYVENTLASLPEYYSTDEYGRVFKASITYGAMPNSAPVPIPTPSKTVQVAPINIPYNN